MRAILRVLSSSSAIECAHPRKCGANSPPPPPSSCLPPNVRLGVLAMPAWRQTVCGTSSKQYQGEIATEGVLSRRAPLEHQQLHGICSIVEVQPVLSFYFLGGAISVVACAGNCPLPLRRDEVSCCERNGDICGLVSVTISHTSSEEAEDVGAGVCAPCARLCLFLRRHRLPNTTGGPRPPPQRLLWQD